MKALTKVRSPQVFTVLALVSLCRAASDAQAQVSAEDYARAERMLAWNAGKLVYHTPVNPNWLEGDRFWYRKPVPDGKEFIFVDPSVILRRPAFDHAKLAGALSTASGHACEPYNLPFEEFEYADGMKAIRFWEESGRMKGGKAGEEVQEVYRRWTCNLTTYECAGPENIPQDPIDQVNSPDGRWAAFERDENLWVRSTETGEEIQLSKNGEKDFGYAVHAEGCCREITTRRQKTKRKPLVFWSPDSKRIATHKLDERKVGEMHLIETHEGRPILHSYHYALPGDTEIPTYTLHIFDVASRS